MELVINGQPRTVPDAITVTALLDELSLHASRVAVEVNQDVVSRKTFDAATLRDGDRIEIVTFVGGG